MDSAIEQILTQVETILQAVDAIGQVSRDGVDALSIQRFPACVISVNENVPEQLLNDYIDWTLGVSITCWIAAEGDLSKTLEAHKAVVQQAIAADAHIGLGDKCDTVEGPWSGPFPMNESLTEAADTKRYDFRYRTLRTDPYTLVA